MATIQFRRNLKYAHPKEDALNYIKTKLKMAEGEPLICTYKNADGKWGTVTVVCVYSKDNESPSMRDTILSGSEYDSLFDAESGKLIENYIDVLSNEDSTDIAGNKWENIEN